MRLKMSLEQSWIKRPPTSTESEIVTIADSCAEVASRVLEATSQLGLNNDRHQSLIKLRVTWAALKAVWNKDRLFALEQKLRALREELMLAILMDLREEVISSAKISANASNTQKVNNPSTIEQQILKQTQCVQRWQKNLKITLDHIGPMIGMTGARTEPATPISMPYWSQTEFGKSLFNNLLLQLYSPELEAREKHINQAYDETFEWIFREPHKSTKRWSNFVSWLQSDAKLYWITGKAGSGKSTLMKFIVQNSQTREILRTWAPENNLVIASFYFWNAGTEAQTSQTGLLRTLLYQALCAVKEKGSDEALLRWTSFALSQDLDDVWTWEVFEKAFEFLQVDSSVKFCFFIDGLDEFQGDPTDLIQLLHRISAFTNIKICVSSRPWLVFEDEFSSKPHLMLQHLTLPDIKHFVNSNLSSNPAFKELQSLDPQLAEDLVDKVAENSSGVFLWVVLAVRSLAVALRDGDRLSDLHRILDSLPSELEHLFKRMLHNFESSHFSDASALFQIFRAAGAPLSLIALAFAEEKANIALNATMQPLTSQQQLYQAIRMRRRLNSRCRGLLEITVDPKYVDVFEENESELLQTQQDTSSNLEAFVSTGSKAHKPNPAEATYLAHSRVEYLHRTVKEFLEMPDIWSQICAATHESFNPYSALCRSYLLQWKWLYSSNTRSAAPQVWDCIYKTLQYAVGAEELGDVQVSLLNNLEEMVIKTLPPSKLSFREGQNLTMNAGLKHFTSRTTEDDFDFLHLVAQCGLSNYLEIRIRDLKQHELVLSLLKTATLQFSIDYRFEDGSSFRRTKPDNEMIRMLRSFSKSMSSPRARLAQSIKRTANSNIGAGKAIYSEVEERRTVVDNNIMPSISIGCILNADQNGQAVARNTHISDSYSQVDGEKTSATHNADYEPSSDSSAQPEGPTSNPEAEYVLVSESTPSEGEPPGGLGAWVRNLPLQKLGGLQARSFGKIFP